MGKGLLAATVLMAVSATAQGGTKGAAAENRETSDAALLGFCEEKQIELGGILARRIGEVRAEVELAAPIDRDAQAYMIADELAHCAQEEKPGPLYGCVVDGIEDINNAQKLNGGEKVQPKTEKQRLTEAQMLGACYKAALKTNGLIESTNVLIRKLKGYFVDDKPEKENLPSRERMRRKLEQLGK